MNSHTPRFEAMTVGMLLDRAFRLYGRNLALMLGIVAAAYVPLYAIHLAIEAGVASVGLRTGSLTANLLSQLALLILWVSVALPLATGAATYAISERYLGNDVTVFQALKRALKRFVTLAVAQLIIIVRVFFGFLLFIVPGILWSLSYALVIPVVLVEGHKAAPSLRRSWELVKGNRKKVFAVMVVVWVLQGLLGIGVKQVVGLFFTQESLRTGLLQTALTDAVSMFLTPLVVIADILLYYDFRIRKEGFDLEMLSRSLAAHAELDAVSAIHQ